jgi:hypothetical protein
MIVTKLTIPFIAMLLLLSCMNKDNNSTAVASLKNDKDVLESKIFSPDSLRTFPFVTDRVNKIETVLRSGIPVLLLSDSINEQQQRAQQLAVKDPAFLFFSKDSTSGTPYRNEIFGVYAARASDLAGIKPELKTGSVFRVEMYNYALNLTSVAIADLQGNKIVRVNHFPQSQPDLPTHLKTLAAQIAVNSPEVAAALGFTPNSNEALMAATKTSLNRTRCERSRHLCVAPTFVKDGKALWAIVDLTEHRLAGIRWTATGTTGGSVITERKLQNDKLTACFCEQETPLEKDGWKMKYILTSSDGLRISEVNYNNRLVLYSAKLVDWHVSYSNTDGFGYSDAVGCPEFSHAAVIANEPPVVRTLKNDAGAVLGFVLEQTFASEGWPTPCNYSYKQRFEFYTDGRFRISCASLGRGCGNNGTYRPVFRIAPAGEQNNFFEWNGNGWQNWAAEKWQQQGLQTAFTPEGYQYKFETGDGNGFYMEPGKGQFNDGGRGDDAFVYVTKWHPDKDEGDADLVTIGPCCNTDYHQGPEKFMEPSPEKISASRVVIWYVPQLKNDNTKGREYCWAESFTNKTGTKETKVYPCYAGPLFIPVKK